ncbi:MAG: hypothetical protein M1837_007017 [Sclerophora amabilis]|nr:MAG: hypothetical protein M1837_007017 [Sclerophora amabilis]
MDAPDDRDVKLQRRSADLLADLGQLLPKALWKASDDPENEKRRPRSRVKQNSIDRLVSLIEPFQEWPQLLDPQLATLLPALISAFTRYLNLETESAKLKLGLTRAAGTLSLHRAICRLLYTFCKVRGEKVVSRFFMSDPGYLEPLLAAFERWDQPVTVEDPDSEDNDDRMTWEERYIILLWLSHLMLAPFDLATMSSETTTPCPAIPRISVQLSKRVPNAVARLLSVGFRYIGSPSKERESAVTLLVRLSVRSDMQRIGLMDSLVESTLSELAPNSECSPTRSTYEHVGTLSFLSGLLVSADHSIIDRYLLPVFDLAQSILHDENVFYVRVRSSALARKILIKICRVATVQSLKLPESASILESSIGVLLSALADHDTPVRYAASKALSIVTVKLDGGLASEVVDAVIGSLEEDVLWADKATGRQIISSEEGVDPSLQLERDLSAVNSIRWHGLTLALAHILFRRSSFPEQLPHVINALVLALEFEQRSSTQRSIGTNIRDAACFGVWALSRKYTTVELAKVSTSQILAASRYPKTMSALQLLANELVTAACLDPAGNIRRGASAALQEMVGRHPDAIESGIALVQVVDYHGVALRSRAMLTVAAEAADLNPIYWEAIMDNIESWRGLNASSADSRRLAAKTIGVLSTYGQAFSINDRPLQVMERLASSFRRLRPTEVEGRHGNLLALSTILERFHQTNVSGNNRLGDNSVEITTSNGRAFAQALDISCSALFTLTENDFSSSMTRPDLIAEAACHLVSSTMQLLASCDSVAADRNSGLRLPQRPDLVSKCLDLLSSTLSRTEENVVMASSMASQRVFSLLEKEMRISTTRIWIEILEGADLHKSRNIGRGLGYINSLAAIFQNLESSDSEGDVDHTMSREREHVIETLISATKEGKDVETRVAAVQSLANGIIGQGVVTSDIAEVLICCLDDYTIDSRGDVGSWLRYAALNAVSVMSRTGLLHDDVHVTQMEKALLSRVIRLAAEKLDKVRFMAWSCLREIWPSNTRVRIDKAFEHSSQTSSVSYFSQILSLLHSEAHWIQYPLLEGYMTSAGAGSESVIRSSRSALEDFTSKLRIEANQESDFSLLEFGNIVAETLRSNLSSDRKLVPCLETLAFLFDIGVLGKLAGVDEFKWKTLLALVQRSHFKSGNVYKLEAAVKVYGGLTDIAPIRQEAVAKLISMLLHPFPRIRNAASDCLCVTTSMSKEASERLESTDWAMSPKILRGHVHDIRQCIPL